MEKLGRYSQIMVSTNDINMSKKFYKKLGFREIRSHNLPTPWTQITDGSLSILLSSNKSSSLRLSYSGSENTIQKLKDLGLEVLSEDSGFKGMDYAIFRTDYQIQLEITSIKDKNNFQEKKITLLDYMPDFQNIKDFPNDKIGIFGELAIPVKDLDEACFFWEKLGFEVSKMQGPYPWAIAQDGINIIGLHQTKDFENVAITYFGSKMSERVAKLKDLGLDNIEIFRGTGGGDENNVIVKTPENQTFFLFNM